MKTVEALSFLQYSASTYRPSDRTKCVEAAQHAINNGYPHITDKGHCLVVKVENPCGQTMTVVPVAGLEDKVVTTYEPRKEGEYPVLGRHLPQGWDPLIEARFIHVICYTQEQLKREGIEIESDYGVCALNAEMGLEESPMAPETLIRNLSIEHGGNGEWEYNAEEMARSQWFWSKHVKISD
ncbi:MAG: DUF3228 family protein [Candidatus Thorarchaeota archaeon]|jgi:hypothetical protein